MKKIFTCIICPSGCDITATFEDDKLLSAEGATCKRGVEYVTQELVNPVRTISTSVLVENGVFPLVSVRLTKAVPRDKIFAVMEEIRKIKVTAPVVIGQLVIQNVLGLGSDVIVTKNITATPTQSAIVTNCLQGVPI